MIGDVHASIAAHGDAIRPFYERLEGHFQLILLAA